MTSGSHSSYHALQTSLTKNSAATGWDYRPAIPIPSRSMTPVRCWADCLARRGRCCRRSTESLGSVGGKGAIDFRCDPCLHRQRDSVAAPRAGGLSAAAGQNADFGLAISEHHDIDDRIAIYGVFGSAADGRRAGGRIARIWFETGFLDRPRRAGRLFRAGRGTTIVLQYPDQSPGRDRTESRALRHAGPQHVSRAWLPRFRYCADQGHAVWPSRQSRNWGRWSSAPSSSTSSTS